MVTNLFIKIDIINHDFFVIIIELTYSIHCQQEVKGPWIDFPDNRGIGQKELDNHPLFLCQMVKKTFDGKKDYHLFMAGQ